MSSPTPRETRETHRAALARFLRRQLDELDIDQDDLARVVGTDQQKVSLWLKPESKVKPGLSDVLQFPRELARRTLAWLAEEHELVVVERLAVATPADRLAHLARMAKEDGDATSAYAATVGSTDPAKRRIAIRELEESIAEKESALVALKREEAAHVAAIQSARGQA